MKKAVEALVRHGYVLMGIGMALAVTGVFFLADPRRRVGLLRHVAIGLAICGFSVYLVGRICVAVDYRRRSRRSWENSNDEKGQ